MTKIYTLKEPQHVRDDVAMNVALLRYMRFFADSFASSRKSITVSVFNWFRSSGFLRVTR